MEGFPWSAAFSSTFVGSSLLVEFCRSIPRAVPNLTRCFPFPSDPSRAGIAEPGSAGSCPGWGWKSELLARLDPSGSLAVLRPHLPGPQRAPRLFLLAELFAVLQRGKARMRHCQCPAGKTAQQTKQNPPARPPKSPRTAPGAEQNTRRGKVGNGVPLELEFKGWDQGLFQETQLKPDSPQIGNR